MNRSEPSVDLNFCSTHVAIRAELANGTILRLGTAFLEAVEEPDASLHNYTAKILKDSQVKISTTRTADSMTFEAENVDKALGLTLNNVTSSLLGAKVRCCKVFSDTEVSIPWESKVLLIGEIAYVDATTEIVSIKIVSDTAPNVAFIATRPIQTKCPLIFKGVACGYSGSLTTCNKVYESTDGCAGRSNQHRFGGVVIRGELPTPIPGGIDTDVNDPYRYKNGDTYPDPWNGRVPLIP